MNVNFGLFPPIDPPTTGADGKRLKGPERGAARKRLLSARALRDLSIWLGEAAEPRLEPHRAPGHAVRNEMKASGTARMHKASANGSHRLSAARIRAGTTQARYGNP